MPDVSIHATLAGGDARITGATLAQDMFLSTPPSRVATRVHNRAFDRRKFLSTPPSRVATLTDCTKCLVTEVSIHATLAGGDGKDAPVPPVLAVSIHATLAGGDKVKLR